MNRIYLFVISFIALTLTGCASSNVPDHPLANGYAVLAFCPPTLDNGEVGFCRSSDINTIERVDDDHGGMLLRRTKEYLKPGQHIIKVVAVGNQGTTTFDSVAGDYYVAALRSVVEYQKNEHGHWELSGRQWTGNY